MHGFAMVLAMVMMGVIFLISQVLILREFLLVFQGNEFSVGIVLGSWLLLEALGRKTTSKKNTDVLYHLMGHFKKDLSADEKQELREIIDLYHRGLVPLIVPITLINHYVRKYDEPYLRAQWYLHPHPNELQLRNHV